MALDLENDCVGCEMTYLLTEPGAQPRWMDKTEVLPRTANTRGGLFSRPTSDLW